MSDDYLAAIETLWTADVASHEGPFVSFRDVELSPKPARSPHPPILVGGHSDRALRRAARYGDAWHPLEFELEWARDVGLPSLRRLAEAENRALAAWKQSQLRLSQADPAE